MENFTARTAIVCSIVIALGLAFSGWFLRSGIVHFKDSERVVTVKGLSEIEVEADRVIWPIVYKEVGDNLTTLYSKMEATNSKITQFLTTNGIDAKEITVSPPEILDQQADRYATQPALYRYDATGIVTVSSNQVSIIRGLISRQGDLLKQGIAVGGNDYRYMTQYQYTGLNTIKPTMIEQATQNARAAAEKFAHDSASRLGKIKSANQGQFTITNRDDNTPYIKVVRVVTTIEYYLKD